MKEYGGQTIPNATIKFFLNNQLLADVISDEEGLFTLDDQGLSTILVDDTLNFTLTDSDGACLSIEKIVLPEKESVEEVEEVEEIPELDNELKENEEELNREQSSSEKDLAEPFQKKIKINSLPCHLLKTKSSRRKVR